MLGNETKTIIKELNLSSDRKEQVIRFLETVSFYRLKPYVYFIKNNPDVLNYLKAQKADIKDNWDAVIELYRYNIKLSVSIYPYIFLLENVLKAKINRYLTEKYNKNWYRNESLFLKALNLDDFDKEIIDKYYNQKILKPVRDEITALYYKKDSGLTKTQIKSKINKIKYSCSIFIENREYIETRRGNSNVNEFVEIRPTLNYWITMLNINNLWKDEQTESFELEKIFINISELRKKPDEALSLICKKLDDIRKLRNFISHHKQIIGKNSFEKLSLYKIYQNILEMFYILGCENVDWMIGDLTCNLNQSCSKRTFEALYKEFEFIHNFEISIITTNFECCNLNQNSSTL